MKIAIIRQKFVLYGGAEQFADGFIHQLAESGHEVHIFANRWTPSHHKNIHHHFVATLNFNSFFRTLSFARTVAKEIREENFDIVQSHEKTWSQDVYRAGDGCHIKWLHQRGKQISPIKKLFLFLNPFHRLILNLEKNIFESGQCKKIIAISQMVKEDILENYKCPADNISVVYNGVDLKRFHPSNKISYREKIRKQLGIPESSVLILFVGSGFERKGLKFLLQSTKHLKDKDWHLLLMGKGNFGKFLKYAPTEKRNQIIAKAPDPEIEKYYAAADIFILPSIYEPFGNANLEALATGLPVITTKYCGAANIIDHKKNGLVVENPYHPEEIAEKINFLFDPSTRETMGENGRELAEQFPFKRNNSEMLEIYNSLIST
ncbi:MAG: glycosyltransferase family 4 protein [Nitrospina sp.]|jgi:UDP-glucose:(heptosyl)LPS alpha-1,3-glucosyltransferase|nr:glycosyltransferase family 4 protein [Nitrospina sp.]